MLIWLESLFETVMKDLRAQLYIYQEDLWVT